MPAEIRLPSVNAATESGQLVQIRSYLIYLANQLQWEFGKYERALSEDGEVSAGSLENADLYDRLRGYMAYDAFSCSSASSGVSITAGDCRYYSCLGLCSIQLTAAITGLTAQGNTFTELLQLPDRYTPAGTLAIHAAYEDAGSCSALVRTTGKIAVSFESGLSSEDTYTVYITGMYLLKS